MKRLIKPITAGTSAVFQGNINFTPSEFIAMLSSIKELEGSAITFTSGKNEDLILTINGTHYRFINEANTIYENG